MNKSNRNSIIVSLSILSVVIITSMSLIIVRQYTFHQAESRLQDVMLEAESLHNYVQKDMHPAMYQLKTEGRMPSGFYSPEILSSSYITRHVFQEFNQTRQKQNLPIVSYRMAANNPRNTINKADDFELELLNLFNNDSTIKKQTGTFTKDNVKYLYYAKPFLRVEQNCLKCHGQKNEAPHELRTYYKWENGFNWQLNTIPAIEVISTPLVGQLKSSAKINITIFVIALFALIALILFTKSTKNNQIITRQKDELQKTLNKLKETQNQLIQAEKMSSLGVLTAGIAHEINNPLNYILGGYMGIEKYLDGEKELEDKLPAFKNAIEEGLKRSTTIVKGLNNFSRKSEDTTEVCDIHSIIDSSLLMIHGQIKNRIIIKRAFSDKDFNVTGNSGKLQQAFLNLLLNAAQAIEKEGTITIKTTIAPTKGKVTIVDTGCGIEKEKLQKVYDPFFTTKDPGKGTGLGLSIVYNILKEHHAKINISSQKEVGTTITLTFKL